MESKPIKKLEGINQDLCMGGISIEAPFHKLTAGKTPPCNVSPPCNV
jgi:hypothetical protein